MHWTYHTSNNQGSMILHVFYKVFKCVGLILYSILLKRTVLTFETKHLPVKLGMLAKNVTTTVLYSNMAIVILLSSASVIINLSELTN